MRIPNRTYSVRDSTYKESARGGKLCRARRIQVYACEYFFFLLLVAYFGTDSRKINLREFIFDKKKPERNSPSKPTTYTYILHNNNKKQINSTCPTNSHQHPHSASLRPTWWGERLRRALPHIYIYTNSIYIIIWIYVCKWESAELFAEIMRFLRKSHGDFWFAM